MTQEEKQLLLKDLCGKLPYGVKFPYHIEEDSNHRECDCIAVIDSINEDGVEFTYEDNGHPRDWSCPLFQVKPYLRPMSSMTGDEQRTLDSMCDGVEMVSRLSGLKMFDKAFDWLNKNHFDYRGLIPMGLALEATEGMYIVEETVGVKETPTKTFPRINEFYGGSSYRG